MPDCRLQIAARKQRHEIFPAVWQVEQNERLSRKFIQRYCRLRSKRMVHRQNCRRRYRRQNLRFQRRINSEFIGDRQFKAPVKQILCNGLQITILGTDTNIRIAGRKRRDQVRQPISSCPATVPA
mgnify:CR=1 FL=1